MNSRWLGVFAVVAGLAYISPGAMAVEPWPGETWETAANLTPLNPSGWASNLSGACWDAGTRRLWVCTNGPAKFWALREDGVGGFEIEREYSGTGDMEGITIVDTAPGLVFTLDEQARIIRAYAIADGSLAQTWFIDTIPDWGNSGPEGLAFIPDAWLTRGGFADGNGVPYPASVQGVAGYGGIVLIAVQTQGWVYAVDLNTDGTYTYVGRYATSRAESCELTFDASLGRLYILHNIDGNILQVSDLTSVPVTGGRALSTLAEIQVPSGSNIEGFAVTLALTPAHGVGDGWCFFTDDSNASGALRWFRQLPSSIEIAAGDGQEACVNTPVLIPPAVVARDAFGNPLPDFPIVFEVANGGGTVAETDAFTEADGSASSGTWTLGPDPGENTLSASGQGLAGSPRTFHATATPKLPASKRYGLCLTTLAALCAALRGLRRAAS